MSILEAFAVTGSRLHAPFKRFDDSFLGWYSFLGLDMGTSRIKQWARRKLILLDLGFYSFELFETGAVAKRGAL